MGNKIARQNVRYLCVFIIDDLKMEKLNESVRREN